MNRVVVNTPIQHLFVRVWYLLTLSRIIKFWSCYSNVSHANPVQRTGRGTLSIAADFAVAEQEGGGSSRGAIPTSETIQNGWPRLCLCADTLQLYGRHIKGKGIYINTVQVSV